MTASLTADEKDMTAKIQIDQYGHKITQPEITMSNKEFKKAIEDKMQTNYASSTPPCEVHQCKNCSAVGKYVQTKHDDLFRHRNKLCEHFEQTKQLCNYHQLENCGACSGAGNQQSPIGKEEWEKDFWLLWGIAPRGSLKYNKSNEIVRFIHSLLQEKEKKMAKEIKRRFPHTQFCRRRGGQFRECPSCVVEARYLTETKSDQIKKAE